MIETSSIKLPSVLAVSNTDLNTPFRHRACLVKGGRVIGFGESSLGGGRYLNSNFGRSCHAEVNACKMLSRKHLVDSRKVAKDHRL